MLGDICADKNVKIIMEETKNVNCEEGGINSNKLWQLKKKLTRKFNESPTAMIDKKGDLITSSKEIKELAIETFSNRLKRNEVKKSPF